MPVELTNGMLAQGNTSIGQRTSATAEESELMTLNWLINVAKSFIILQYASPFMEVEDSGEA